MTIRSKIAENPKRPTEQDTTSSQIDDQHETALVSRPQKSCSDERGVVLLDNRTNNWEGCKYYGRSITLHDIHQEFKSERILSKRKLISIYFRIEMITLCHICGYS